MNEPNPNNEIEIPSEYARLFDKDWREAAVYGGRNSLKSHSIARVLLARVLQEKTRILCGREFQNSIAESVYQLFIDLIIEHNLPGFQITRDSIVYKPNGSDMFFKGVRRNVQSIKSIEGIDIFWGEEAATFTIESIDILTPTVRKEGSQLIWSYNRLTELDPIHERLVINTPPRTLIISTDYTLAIKYGWLSDSIKTEIDHDKATNPSSYAHKWLGEPLNQADNAIIPRDRILEAMNRTIDDEGLDIYGVDVARMGIDRTVFWHRKGLKTKRTKIISKKTIDQVCDALQIFMFNDKEAECRIDGGGLGIGLYDYMNKDGYNVIDANFGGKAQDSDHYNNWISEAWFNLEEIIDEAELPTDKDLLMELSTRGWKQDSKGRRVIESKAEYKKRGYRSPDLADACIICYADIQQKKQPNIRWL
jgi:phage terminase large subunit